MFQYAGPRQLISGGQTGADRAGLLAAERLGIPTGGWMPRGFLAADGKHPQFAERFGMQQHRSPLYPPRTRENIRAACATVCLEGAVESRGVVLTRELAAREKKPLLRIRFIRGTHGEWQPDHTPADVAAWMIQLQVQVLNVAGNEESKAPGLQHAALTFLLVVLQPWARA